MLKSYTIVHILNSGIFFKIGRWWLVFVLCFLPFQFYVMKNIELLDRTLSTLIRQINLITIVVFTPIALIMMLRSRKIFNSSYVILLFSIMVLGLSGITSGILNGNSIFVSSLGIFEYVKNFFIIFIFAAFVNEIEQLKKIFHFLLIISLFLVAAAFVQEIWALVSRYILNEDMVSNRNYIFQYISNNGIIDDFWRFGIYRVAPFMNSSIGFGLYCLLIVTIYLFFIKKIKLPIIISFLIAIIMSISRIAYTGLMILLGAQILRGRKWMLIMVLPLAAIFIYMSSMSDFNIWDHKDDLKEMSKENINDFEESFRAYTRNKAVEIWKDHPFFGVGPGMFGGITSVKYQSHIYEQYNLSLTNQYLTSIWGIDQFWFQALAESGIIGIGAFAGLFISLIMISYLSSRQTHSSELRGWFNGIILFTTIIPIYAFGITLNITSVLFTYCAFLGMGLGCIAKS